MNVSGLNRSMSAVEASDKGVTIETEIGLPLPMRADLFDVTPVLLSPTKRNSKLPPESTVQDDVSLDELSVFDIEESTGSAGDCPSNVGMLGEKFAIEWLKQRVGNLIS